MLFSCICIMISKTCVVVLYMERARNCSLFLIAKGKSLVLMMFRVCFINNTSIILIIFVFDSTIKYLQHYELLFVELVVSRYTKIVFQVLHFLKKLRKIQFSVFNNLAINIHNTQTNTHHCLHSSSNLFPSTVKNPSSTCRIFWNFQQR